MPRDLSARDFAKALKDQGFHHQPLRDHYLDLRHREGGRSFEPVRDAKNRTLRRQTLAHLLAGRAEAVAAKAAIRAENDRRMAVAERIAPAALPACRADLADEAAIAQLADDYVTRVATTGAVGFGDLLGMGWRPEQLRELGDAARIVADRRQSMVLA